MVPLATNLSITIARITELGERWLEAYVAGDRQLCASISRDLDSLDQSRRQLERRLRR